MAKPLKGTRTEKNLLTAFAGESQARNRYTFFASQARKEGYEQIANIFTETAAMSIWAVWAFSATTAIKREIIKYREGASYYPLLKAAGPASIVIQMRPIRRNLC